MNKARFRDWTRRDGPAAILFLAPGFLGFLLFYIFPFALGVGYSFRDRTVGGTFVGFDNYKALLASGSFRQAAGNTLLFTGIAVPVLIVVSLTLALLLNNRTRFRRGFQTAFVLPLVVPVASIAMIWQIFVDWNGTLNAWLNAWGLPRVDWMNSDSSMGVLVLIYIWKNLGYNMILFLAGLQSIPESYYETARIEGAGAFRQLTSITLTYLTPTMFFVILVSILNSFKIFRETYVLAGDYPYDRIYMMQHFINNMFASLDIQKLTAAATFMVGFIVLLVFGLLAIERRFQENLE